MLARAGLHGRLLCVHLPRGTHAVWNRDLPVCRHADEPTTLRCLRPRLCGRADLQQRAMRVACFDHRSERSPRCPRRTRPPAGLLPACDRSRYAAGVDLDALPSRELVERTLLDHTLFPRASELLQARLPDDATSELLIEARSAPARLSARACRLLRGPRDLDQRAGAHGRSLRGGRPRSHRSRAGTWGLAPPDVTGWPPAEPGRGALRARQSPATGPRRRHRGGGAPRQGTG